MPPTCSAKLSELPQTFDAFQKSQQKLAQNPELARLREQSRFLHTEALAKTLQMHLSELQKTRETIGNL